MRLTKWPVIVLICVCVFCFSFIKSISPAQAVAICYDQQLDGLLSALNNLQRLAKGRSPQEELKRSLLDCRARYKKIEFLADLFDPYKARLLNGPAVIKIDEDNPNDSIEPHGFQVVEALVYNAGMNRKQLNAEIGLIVKNTLALRKDHDRIYYFKDDKIWKAARLGVYRIISLGVTGFDVPLSDHALPETRAALAAIHKTLRFYKENIGDSLEIKGDTLFNNADYYLSRNTHFNTFDRMTFIRDHLNRISEWIMVCGRRAGFLNTAELNPLNAGAKNLFAPDIMNLAFFSINEKYRLTSARIALGEKLFCDTRLSGNDTRSCASCHQPRKGFADGLPKPANINSGEMLLRNTPTLLNAALQTRQFYDSRSETLENQLNAVVHNADEMNGSLRNSVPKLAADPEYANAFQLAYPGDGEFVSAYHIGNAISSYVRSLISLNSRFDRYIRRETDSFTAAEKNGFNLFMGKARCGTCHYAPVFNGLTPPLYEESESEILGVPATDKPGSGIDGDPGKYGFTKALLHKYAFKTPTVRNVALTAPYMHNGVFASLDDVVDFYNDGGGAGRGVALPGQTLPSAKLRLTKKEKKDIVAFLYTLTDTSATTISYYKIE